MEDAGFILRKDSFLPTQFLFTSIYYKTMIFFWEVDQVEAIMPLLLNTKSLFSIMHVVRSKSKDYVFFCYEISFQLLKFSYRKAKKNNHRKIWFSIHFLKIYRKKIRLFWLYEIRIVLVTLSSHVFLSTIWNTLGRFGEIF